MQQPDITVYDLAGPHERPPASTAVAEAAVVAG